MDETTTMDDQGAIRLRPVGVIHSRIVDRRLMPLHGAPASLEVFAEYADGLLHIEENSHIWVIGWYTGAERDQLQIVRPEYPSGLRRRGVFGLRSTTRPNSIALSASRVLAVDDTTIQLEKIDLLDGTVILDIKRYSPSWDAIFAARSSRERFAEIALLTEVEELEHAASIFHGSSTPAMIAGARLVQFVCRLWGARPKDDELRMEISLRPEYAGLTDAIQGITAATVGSGRLVFRVDPGVRFHHQSRALTALPLDVSHLEPKDLRIQPIEDLFDISEA